MKTDAQLKADICQELEWDPSVDAAHVGVTVEDAIVTLSGHLATFAEKHAIERAVMRVAGVKAVAMELDVRLSPSHQRNDTEIAAAAQSALQWHSLIPAERIHVMVEHGWISLSGEVDWDFQRRSAVQALRSLTGVIGVRNGITLKPVVTPTNITVRICEALARHAAREARHIEVTVNGSIVTLRGRVDSWAERAAVQGAAWSAPGINRVDNYLGVGPAP